MHSFFKCKIFCSGQSHTRGCDTFYGRIVCQIDEQYGSVDGTCFLKTFHKEIGFFKGNTHSGKDNCKGFIGSNNLSLTCNLRSELLVRKTGS